MSRRGRNGSGAGVRRGLAYLVMILAAGAAVFFIASEERKGSEVIAPAPGLDAAKKPESTNGGVGDQEKRTDASPAVVVDPKPEASEAAVAKANAVTKAHEEDEVYREKRPSTAKVIKIGQMQVVGSESLDFSSELVKPGWMWLPIGLHEVSSGDPWVTMCLMDYGHYQANPAATPMFTHMNTFSKCGQKRPAGTKEGERSMGSVELVRMSSLMRSIKESGQSPVPPKGFVYHETRCGSTLVANMLAALPPSRVFSESKPPTQAIRECHAEGCNEETMLSIFRNVVALMGRRREGEKHQHLYFKFQNSKFIPEISAAFPEVPWVFVFRDPVEVMVSNLKSFVGAPCVRIPRQEKLRQAANKKLSPPVGPAAGLQINPDIFRGRVVGRGAGLREQGGGRRRRLDGERGGLEQASPQSNGTVGHALQEGIEGDEPFTLTSLSSNGLAGFGIGSGIGGVGAWEGIGDLYDEHGDRGEPRAAENRRVLVETLNKKSMKLTMNMSMECADWLMSLCVSAVKGGENFPSNALFVDYANLPEAIPEYVFPEHFGMAAEVDKAVPDWKERMYKAAGSYSKGGGKSGRGFVDDAESKHKQASPHIIEAAGLKGGLYDIYHTLDAKQIWHRSGPVRDSAESLQPNENRP